MLVLTRKLQEKIQIGNEITLTIVRIQGNTVRVGIEAPQNVRVVRGELHTSEGSSEAADVNPMVGGESEAEAAWTPESADELAPIPANWPRQQARERRRRRLQAARMHSLLPQTTPDGP